MGPYRGGIIRTCALNIISLNDIFRTHRFVSARSPGFLYNLLIAGYLTVFYNLQFNNFKVNIYIYIYICAYNIDISKKHANSNNKH